MVHESIVWLDTGIVITVALLIGLALLVLLSGGRA